MKCIAFCFFVISYLATAIKPAPVLRKNTSLQATFESVMFMTSIPELFLEPKKTVLQHAKSVLRLIRHKNIAPTLAISVTGGWIANPNPMFLIKPEFLACCAVTIAIMSSSMILNDIADYNIDLVNNPGRPLVTGEITRRRAWIYVAALFAVSEIISVKFFSKTLRQMVNITLFAVSIYTPVLKRITFVKNLTCASIVGLSIWFAGMAAANGAIQPINSELLGIAARLLFMGSLNNEIFLDMRDIEGDRIHNIPTIPVFYGMSFAWDVSAANLVFNTVISVIKLGILTKSITSGLTIYVICFPLWIHLDNIKKYDYSIIEVLRAAKQSTIPMLLTLVYFCLLAKFI
jgi:4-hydroxybenzoate polyprenyltransferase